MRLLVTGAKGQLGTELMTILEPSHHDVIGVDLDHGEHSLDITDRAMVLGLVTSWRPDAIIHGAAFTAVDACETQPGLAFRVNSLATRHMADAARQVGAHLTYVSTDYVFDGTKGSAYHEWDRPNPQSIYGQSKLGGEQELDPSATIARTSWVCSAHGNNILKTVLRLAAEGQQLSFVDDQFGHPTFASDLAAMLVRLTVERRPGRFHVTNQGAVSWYDFVREILVSADLDPGLVTAISSTELNPPRPAPRPQYSVLENAALRESGISLLPDFRETLPSVIATLRS